MGCGDKESSLLRLKGIRLGSVSVAYSPDGGTLASGSTDETIRLWDVATGALLATLERHTDWVCGVAYSPNGRTLASGGGDNTCSSLGCVNR